MLAISNLYKYFLLSFRTELDGVFSEFRGWKEAPHVVGERIGKEERPVGCMFSSTTEWKDKKPLQTLSTSASCLSLSLSL